MKKLVTYLSVLLLFACAGEQSSKPSDVAKTVLESIYQGDEEVLKAHTTEEGYASFNTVMAMFSKNKNSDSNFKVLEESMDGDIAWVKYTTSYDKTPGIFKLIKQDGEWKVTARRPKEKTPF